MMHIRNWRLQKERSCQMPAHQMYELMSKLDEVYKRAARAAYDAFVQELQNSMGVPVGDIPAHPELPAKMGRPRKALEDTARWKVLRLIQVRGRPNGIRRQDVVTALIGKNGYASSTIDNALKDLKRDGEIYSKDGRYWPKEEEDSRLAS